MVTHWSFWKLKKSVCVLRRLLLWESEIGEQQTPWELGKSELQRKIKPNAEAQSFYSSFWSLKNMSGFEQINTLL